VDAQFDLVIIGAGIVGLATALKAVRRHPHLRIAVLEKEAAIAMHQTGHNSGVIHSGIYYQPGSVKARNCVAGAAAMIQFCRLHNIPYDQCGKVVVATSTSDVAALKQLLHRGTMNGVEGLSLIGPERLHELEPHCAGVAALHVPTAGITDFGAVAREYAELIVAEGGRLLTSCRVLAINKRQDRLILESDKGAISTSWAINCAGLHSDRVRRLAGDKEGPDIVPFRGEYYKLLPNRAHLVKNLVYPVPDVRFPFLGVHFTRMINGGVDAGPNAVMAFKREGYRKTDFNLRDVVQTATFPGFWRMATKYWSNGLAEMYRSFNKQAFTVELQKLIPEIESRDLTPGGSGVRAQALDRSGKLLDDFSIVPSGPMIHVCNVPSPAATASLVIADQIMDIAQITFGLPMPIET
jgi:L-2-hydroxyglutarate oxidase LhgO